MAPPNNGRTSAGSHDRLIFNDAGESVKAIPLSTITHPIIKSVRLQMTGFRDGHATTEIELRKREAIAFIMQIATAIGVACEVRE